MASGYLSNAELANMVAALVERYNVFTDQQIGFFTTSNETAPITLDNTAITVPSLKALLARGTLSIYATTAAGLAATASGQFFQVLENAGEYLALYRNNGGVAIAVAKYPSRDAVAGTSFMEDITSAIGRADAVMLTPFNEFDLDTTAQVDSSGAGFNTVLDELVNNITFAEARTNFIYMCRDDLARLTGVRTVMVWTQWFSVCSSIAGTDPGAVQPAINAEIAEKLSRPSQWEVAGKTPSNALQLAGRAGGTQNEASQIRGMKHLIERGYQVGFVPIVLGRVNDGSLAESQALVWRGFFNFSSTQALSSWIDSYKAFHAHYIALFKAHGIVPACWYVASELSAIERAAPDAQWAIWVAACADIAASVKAAFPNCAVTYAANYTEYGVGAGYRLDAIWSNPQIDSVGIEWYFRLTTSTDGSAEEISSGLVAGEDMDYTCSTNDGAQRKLTGSSGKGKTSETRTPIDPSAGIKNTIGFWQGCHYVPKRSGHIAEATSQAGYGRGYDPFGLAGMEGNATTAVESGFVYPGTSGSHMPPPDTATFLRCDGTSSGGYGKVTTPTYSGGSQTDWSITLDFQVTALPADNYARVLELAGYVELMLDQGGGFKLGVGGSYYITLGALDTMPHTLRASLNRATNILTVVWDGASADYGVDSGSAIAIPSGASLYLGGYNENYAMTACKIFKFALFFTRNNQRWGGTFHFDESYAGVRTAWTPKMKRISATELGFASIGGTCVEPSQFTYADLGSQPLALPAILNATTRSIYESFFAAGWKPVEVYSSYGSSFNYAPFEQVYALRETLRYMESLQLRGMMDSICLYNIDARPAAAMAATLNGSLYYTDAPMNVFGHALNGKLAGGSTLFHSRILASGSIF
ncbi:glycoside hydrolase TIM-barrel-like domain-containing protein [uncultured Xanthomonas sp.]|uniref:baseplate megatron protein TIM-barrel domain-containing protein n=1 Tax=uncultured Xanthomonas sp. TaxID=152831 RepID=UPI0025D74617|nr:glycoside hydrolase TIM-barrel-like domain-containing protein [uncultured Xanthomonas sp.]